MSARTTRPLERFWPYVEKPEEPTADELAALDPDLHAALFGPRNLPFSLTLVFGPFEGAGYARAVEMAKASAEYRRWARAWRCGTARASSRATRCACATCSRW
jgi:hypothetical protein